MVMWSIFVIFELNYFKIKFLMKKSLLIVCSMLFAWVTNAQIIFSGESPASIQGAYDMTYGDPGGGWGSPDLLDPANAVLDTLALYLDTSAGDSLGCLGTAAAATDVVGKIAVLYRGDCEFGTKALNAENSGAIACVVINNIPGAPVGLGAGADGASITIPIVMISDVDGATLTAEMENGAVEVFIGNKTGFYPTDVGTLPSAILRAQQFATPSLIAQDDTEFSFDVGAWVYNFGFNDQTTVSLSATVDFGGTELYNETATAVDIPAGDSAFFQLPVFSETSYAEGFYELNYTITSDSVDFYDFDNTITSKFAITESLYGYASLDETTVLPTTSGGLRPVNGDGSAVGTYLSCIHFQDPNASRIAPTGITFTSIKANDAADPSLEGEPINISVYELNDVFTDLNDPNYANPPNSITEIAFDEYFYAADLPSEGVTAEFETPFALVDNQRYLFCVTTFNEELFFGHDPDMDYSWNLQNYLQPLFPIQADGDWNLNGFGAETVPGVTVNFVDAAQVNLQNEKLSIEFNAYPSPASDVLTVDFNGYDVENIEMLNLTGQRVAGKSLISGQESTVFDVNGLENGVYVVKAYLTNGMVETMQVVVSH
jgi:hypothetical protein